jgi:hypothetical protein
MKALLSLAAILLLPVFVFAQVDGLPEVRYDKQSKPQSIFINYELNDPTCVRSVRRNLKLVKIGYADGETERIDNLIFADARNRRESFGLDLYFGDFVTVDEGWAKKLIGERLIYNIGIIACGAGGKGDPFIFSLEPAVKPAAKKRRSTK